MIDEATLNQLRMAALMQRDGMQQIVTMLKPVEGLENIVAHYRIIVSECDQIIKELE